MVTSDGVSFRCREKRFRKDERSRIAGGASCTVAVGGFGGFGEGAGLYVRGARMNSGSGSANSTSDVEDCSESSSGVLSRSSTIWNVGKVACIAGVMRFGSDGRCFDIDCRTSRVA